VHRIQCWQRFHPFPVAGLGETALDEVHFMEEDTGA
jgi:hypothetical protein